LPDKQFGVFDSAKKCEPRVDQSYGRPHPLPAFALERSARRNDLTSCGYTVLTESAEAGVDLFVKKKKKSLFVHFQGHPEYGAQTLLKEYRRDIKRFLRQKETHIQPLRRDTSTRLRLNF
jgi:homoserine O-succinyltransferase/O-acetyltransferase